jgi:hypothetical protein
MLCLQRPPLICLVIALSAAYACLSSSRRASLHLSILDNHRLQPLALLLLDVHRLHIAVQLLLRALLVVTLSRDPHPQSIWNTLDTRLPDFLVELRVETHVGGALVNVRIYLQGMGDGKGGSFGEI